MIVTVLLVKSHNMRGMAGRTVPKNFTTTAATQGAPTGAAPETTSEEITEATTEATIEVPFAVVVAVDGMTTIDVHIVGTRIGVNPVHGSGQADPEVHLMRDLGETTVPDRTTFHKVPQFSGCQTWRKPRREPLR